MHAIPRSCSQLTMRLSMQRPVLARLAILSATFVLFDADWSGHLQRAALAKSTDAAVDGSPKQGLVGYWKLRGDCSDHSGLGNHGTNHGVDLVNGTFDGKSAYIEVPHSTSLNFGAEDFSLC